MENQDQLIRILQTAISPVVLISGVGLLVLSMTNRFSRTTERARGLAAQRDTADDVQRARIERQIRILYSRSQILLVAISLALTSALLAALLIATLFTLIFSAMSLQYLVVVLFLLSLVSLIVSLILFIWDMTLSLKALWEEVGHQP